MNKKKPARLHKQLTWQDYIIEYADLFYLFACFAVVAIIILLFVCIVSNFSFVESGVMRNFLARGV